MAAIGVQANVTRSLKESTAITSNHREAKILDKKRQTLGLEQTYSIKLLEIDERVLKIRFHKLKTRVAKIKSNLTHDEIAEIKEEEFRSPRSPSRRSRLGTLSSDKTVDSGRKTTNRVSFANGRHSVTPGAGRKQSFDEPRVHSAGYRSTTPLVASPSSRERHPSAVTVNSVFTDNPDSETTYRAHRDGVTTVSSFYRRSISPHSLPRYNNGTSLTSSLQPTSTTTYQGDPFGFNSHLFTDKTRSASALSPPARSRSRQSASTAVGSVSSDMAISDTHSRLVEEQRLMLIDENLILAAELEDRKSEFLQKVDELVVRDKEDEAKRYAELQEKRLSSPELTAKRIEELRQEIRDKKINRRLHRFQRPNLFDFERKENESDEDYTIRIQAYIKELSKCRYLRIPKTTEEHTGVQTLVHEQMRIQRIWRNSLTHNLL
ncbi:uncharacterized protein LOC144443506 [Glandiceps talaboti]